METGVGKGFDAVMFFTTSFADTPLYESAKHGAWNSLSFSHEPVGFGELASGFFGDVAPHTPLLSSQSSPE